MQVRSVIVNQWRYRCKASKLHAQTLALRIAVLHGNYSTALRPRASRCRLFYLLHFILRRPLAATRLRLPAAAFFWQSRCHLLRCLFRGLQLLAAAGRCSRRLGIPAGASSLRLSRASIRCCSSGSASAPSSAAAAVSLLAMAAELNQSFANGVHHGCVRRRAARDMQPMVPAFHGMDRYISG